MKAQIDRPIAQLVRDLDERGLLDRTLIILASEFSRDAMLEGAADNPAEQGSDLQEAARHSSPSRSSTACTGTSPAPAPC